MRSKIRCQLKLLLLMTFTFVAVTLWLIILGRNDGDKNSVGGSFAFITPSSNIFSYDFFLRVNNNSADGVEELLQTVEEEDEASADAFEELMDMAPLCPLRLDELVGRSQKNLNPMITQEAQMHDYKSCQMENCFDFKKCQNDLIKVYVYPPDKFVPISTTYEKILNRVMSSPYYTNDPDEACLFILSIDTLDRDSLSHDFVRNLGSRLNNLEVCESSIYNWLMSSA